MLSSPGLCSSVHSEVQQTEMSAFGAVIYYRTKQRNGQLSAKNLNSNFRKRVFKDSVRGEVHRMCEQLMDILLIGSW